MDTRDQIFDRIVKEHELAERYEGPPSSVGWERWLENFNPDFSLTIQKKRHLVNQAMRRQVNGRDFARLVHRWCDAVREGMDLFHAVAPKVDDWLAGDEVPKATKTLFFDLETQKSASEVGGWDNADKMLLSYGAVFHLEKRELRVYGPQQPDQLAEDLATADLVVGFNHVGFDLKVIDGQVPGIEWDPAKQFDMMVDCEAYMHRRPSLQSLAGPTLGAKKLGSGLDALAWWQADKHADIVKYLIQDVRVTYEVFAHGCREGQVLYLSPYMKKNLVSVPIPTAHWRTGKPHTEWQGQMALDGTVTCPLDRKKQKPPDAAPPGSRKVYGPSDLV